MKNNCTITHIITNTRVFPHSTVDIPQKTCFACSKKKRELDWLSYYILTIHTMFETLINEFNAWKTHIPKNIWSGITVALISLPLSIALAIASGGTPLQGIITGVWATMCASLLGGSNYNIIGVAGALSSVLFGAVVAIPQADPNIVLGLMALVTGIIIIGIWALKLDTYLRYIPASVMYGFATGVAVLIAANQIFDGLGITVKKSGEFIHNMKLLVENIGSTHMLSLGIFIVFLALLLVWKRYVKKLPGIIPISILGIATGYVLPILIPNNGVLRLVDKFGNLSAKLINPPSLTQIWSIASNPDTFLIVLKTGAIVALIAVLETLITARIADRMTKTESSARRELFGLGSSNLVSGLVGGLPSTGVFIRTGANVKAGATHKSSQFIAAVVTGLLALLVMPLFQFTPLPVIAAILFNTAIGLIEVHAFKVYWKEEKISFFLGMFVTLVTILKDAGVAVIVGVVIGIFILIDRISREMVSIHFNKAGTLIEKREGFSLFNSPIPASDTVVFSFAGFVNYLCVHQNIAMMQTVITDSGASHLILRIRDLYEIDLESIEALSNFITKLQEQNIRVDIASAQTQIAKQLTKDETFKKLMETNHFFDKTSLAFKV